MRLKATGLLKTGGQTVAAVAWKQGTLAMNGGKVKPTICHIRQSKPQTKIQLILF